MTRSTLMISAALMAMGGLVIDRPAIAQQPHEAPHAQTAPGSEADTAEEPETFPVFAVTSVEILRSKHAPVMDIVVVNGLTSADGWSNGALIPLRRGPSSDGVLDLVFIADAPQESAAPTAYVPVQAVLPLASDHPFKAVRIRGATNSVLVQELPGYAEAKRPAEPCKSCVGKVFVPKNGTPPSSAASTEVVKEEDLPANVRVVHHDDGVGDTRHDPNRLTIIIGEDGRIADAAWE